MRHGVREIYHCVREVNHGLRVVYHGVREVYHCIKEVYHDVREVLNKKFHFYIYGVGVLCLPKAVVNCIENCIDCLEQFKYPHCTDYITFLCQTISLSRVVILCLPKDVVNCMENFRDCYCTEF